MENKKSGIRLRHLQQQPQEAVKRDLSPNNPNRKKIFDKNQRMRANEKAPLDEKQRRRGKNEEESFNQYEELVDNLKKKTMELELRDEAIKYLNKQIEDLKATIKLKDKEIGKLNNEISLLHKEHQASKTVPMQSVFDSFKNPSQVAPSFSDINRHNSHNQSTEIVNARPKAVYQERQLNEQISMGNLNSYKNSYEQKSNESEILSPFMALNNTHSFSSVQPTKDRDRDNRKQVKTSRINQNVSQHSSTEYSGFNKKKSNNEFDFREEYVPKKTMIDSVNKQLQKFNIFGEPVDSKKEIFTRSKLQIEDSRQFKFQQFEDRGYGDFGSNVIY